MRKKIIIYTSLIGLIIIIIVLFTGNGNEEKSFKTVKVDRGVIVDKALAIGEITPITEIQVKSKIGGIVKRRYVEVGDEVELGQILVEITPDPTPLEITEARRNLEIAIVGYDQARSKYDRRKELYDRSLISKQEFELDQQVYEEAKLRKILQEEKLSLIEKGQAGTLGSKVESIVKSPISGMVLEKFINQGDPVVPLTSYQAGTPLFTLANMEKLIFRGTIDEIDVGKVELGMKAVMKIGALPGKEVLGTVERISPKAKKVENATLFDIEITIDPDNKVPLRAGYSANADIIIRKVEDVVKIPERLISFSGDTAYTELFDSTTNEISKVQLKLGLSDGVDIEVLEGLDTTKVVVERPPKEIE